MLKNGRMQTHLFYSENKKMIKGFTLIELLMVIAIIGILSGVVLVSTQSAVEKSKKASAITSAASVLPELVTCQDDGGYAKNSAPNAGEFVCCKVASVCGGSDNANAVDGHSSKWPDVTTKTGWAYASTSGDITSNSYVFTLTKTISGTLNTITCNMSANSCS
jgi:prepilin-type N-terminal cleavage/methylation domain-containing protein